MLRPRPSPASARRLASSRRSAFLGERSRYAVSIQPASFGWDQRYRLRAPAANQDRFARIRYLIHERGQVSTRIPVGGFVEHLWTIRYK